MEDKEIIHVMLGNGSVGFSLRGCKGKQYVCLEELSGEYNTGDKIGKEDKREVFMMISSDKAESFDVAIKAFTKARDRLRKQSNPTNWKAAVKVDINYNT